ncbi:MAG: TonB-dependent receptor [Candidatus Marinimicrobia bacterium]|nr:TonB-dependent receptor [Candidatus Neomarinimicrobiota bacterium]MBL7011060.1 TonB-dependent receptor [Candidatus Neomarinimicrobiota bacterium]MBL7030783.1 TonB-dependent receptor [Candidatus Neomarinimicrobiota bacterium]
MKKWFSICLFFFAGLMAQTVSGYIVDEETGETIIGVNVIVEGTDKGAISDPNGLFVLTNLKADSIHIRFSHIAYAEKTQSVNLTDGSVYLNKVILASKVLELSAIEVVSNRGNLVQRDMDIGSFEADPVLLKEIPQLDKDIYKLIKLSPSVTIGDEYSPLYNVRGSDPGENLVQLDGMTIYNPQEPMAGRSLFNPYSIKNIEMLVGGFDASFGGRNASILYLTMKEGTKGKPKGEFKPSTQSMKGTIEFPMGSWGTAMVSGRFGSSLMQRVFLNMPNHNYDINSTFLTEIGNTRLRFSLFTNDQYVKMDMGFMKLFMDDDVTDAFDFSLSNKSKNLAVGIQSRSILSPSFILETHFYRSRFEVDSKSYMFISVKDTVYNIDQKFEYDTQIHNSVDEKTAKVKLTGFLFWGQQLSLGAELNQYQFENAFGVNQMQRGIISHTPNLLAWFIQDKIDSGPVLFKFGVRNTKLGTDSNWYRDPRISLALRFGDKTFKVAWGIYRQFLKSMNTSDVEVNQTTDYYFPLTQIAPLTSEHRIFGFEHRISNEWEYSISAFHKNMSLLYRYDYQLALKAASEIETLEKGKGFSYGIETMVKGEWNRISGWVGYAWSVSKRSYPSIMDGSYYFASGDQTHQLKSLLAYRISKDITFSTTIQITSGYPKTWETGMANHYVYNPLANNVGIYGEYITPVKNNVRYPARMKVDMGWRKKLRSGFGYRLAQFLGTDKVYFTMKINNILFLRRNPFMYIYTPKNGYYAYDPLAFIPIPTASAGYTLEF